MRPLTAMPDGTRRAIRGVLTDIDDTLSTHGRIEAAAYAAMARLRAAGRLVIPITGRPAGWCDHIARMWPVDAVVGENGALYMRHDDANAATRPPFRRRRTDAARQSRAARGHRREDRRARSPAAHSRPTRAIAKPTSPSTICEDVPPLPRDAVDRIVAMMQAEGMTAKVSSIHVNGWFGRYDKLTMTRTLLAEAFAIDLDAEREHFVFAGDSPNDAPMFAFFPQRGRRGERARVRRSNRDAAGLRHARRGRRRVRRARGFPTQRVGSDSNFAHRFERAMVFVGSRV